MAPRLMGSSVLGRALRWRCTAHRSTCVWPHGTSVMRASRAAVKQTSQQSSAADITVAAVVSATMLLPSLGRIAVLLT